MRTTVDAAGNLRSTYSGNGKTANRLLIGSHLDTVPNAGAYDGILGVVLGVALIQLLQGRRYPFDIEVIGFSEEEGVRFGVPFMASRALAGTLDPETLERKDSSGISIKQAIESFGLDASQIPDAATNTEEILGFLEFHIEQGPVLDSLGQPLAIVEAISGQTRASIAFIGKANHAGTTPMHLRYDALAGAAEWIQTVEHHALCHEGLVATVGSIEAHPGASNVIPGDVRLTLDVRHRCDAVRDAAVDYLLQQAKAIARRRGLQSEHEIRLTQPTVTLDSGLIGLAERALAACDITPIRTVSGAGHDAMIMSERVPSVMIFLRSPEGISHHPDETVRQDDVKLALAAGLQFLNQLAGNLNL